VLFLGKLKMTKNELQIQINEDFYKVPNTVAHKHVGVYQTIMENKFQHDLESCFNVEYRSLKDKVFACAWKLGHGDFDAVLELYSEIIEIIK
jgi:hypothetical protein